MPRKVFLCPWMLHRMLHRDAVCRASKYETVAEV